MKVCLCFGFFGMLRQSNMTPRFPAAFEISHSTCRGDIILAPPGLLVVIDWTKPVQAGGASHLLPFAHIPNHTVDPFQVYTSLSLPLPPYPWINPSSLS